VNREEEEAPDPRDPVGDWLARYDDALMSGRTPPDPASGTPGVDPVEIDRYRELLEKLHHALRPGPLAIAPGGSDTAEEEVGQASPLVDRGTIGRYRILRELGRGGFGIVFLADDPTMDRRVALKIPRADAVALPETRRRFLREAQAAARLDHPNLVPVFDSGEDDHFCYIASAYCEGPTLREWIKGGHAPTDPFLAARFVLALARAIEHMHARGLLHCDLKPGNILLDLPEGSDPIPRITDFGLARLAERVAGDSTTMHLWGTPPYMAPEQILQRRDETGPPTDVYALGAILCELLAGRPPHEGRNSFELSRAVVSDPPRSPRSLRRTVPADLDAIVLKCLEKGPEGRYENARELADDLERFLERRPTRARPLGPFRRSARWAIRNPLAAALTALGVVTVVVSLVYSAALSRANKALDLANQAERSQYRVATLALADAELRRGRVLPAQRRLRELIPAPGEADERDFAWHYTWRQARRDRTVLDDLFPGGAALVATEEGRLLGSSVDWGPVLWHFDWPEASERPALGPPRPTFHRLCDLLPGYASHGGLILPGRRFAVLDAVEKAVRSESILLVGLDPPETRLLSSQGATRIAVRPHDGAIALAAPHFWEVESSHPASFTDGPLIDQGNADAGGKPSRTHLVRESWELNGRTIPVFRVPGSLDVAFSGDGETVASCRRPEIDNGKGTLQLWDANTGDRIDSFGNETISYALAFSPERGGPLATGTPGGIIRLRDPRNGTVLGSIDAPEFAGRQSPGVHALTFSPDGQRLAAGHGRFAILWDLRTRQPIARIDDLGDRVNSIAFLPGSTSDIALGLGTGDIVIWHLEPIEPARVIAAHEHEVWGVVYDPEGKWLATVGGDHRIKLWDPRTGESLESLGGTADWPTAFTVDPSGRWLAASDFSGKVLVWDMATRKIARELAAHPDRIRSIAFSPNGRWLATCSRLEQVIRVWETGTWKLVAELSKQGDLDRALRGLAFSPDSQTLASTQPLLFWRTDTWKVRSRGLEGAPSDSICLAYSPDGRTLALGDRQGVIQLLDVASGTKRAELKGLHTEQISEVSFSPDGRLLAAGSEDGIISLIDVETGRSHISLIGHEKGIMAIAWSPDGRTLASASLDHTLRLWWAGPASP
jgi:WD40 repeat protein